MPGATKGGHLSIDASKVLELKREGLDESKNAKALAEHPFIVLYYLRRE
jgi:hypothetical protein